MIIVGEKINTSRKRIAEAVEKRDADAITEVARQQAEAGANYIDVNAGTFLEQETDCLCWLVETVQQSVDLPLCLDSPNPKALAEAIKCHRGEPMINSISLEPYRYQALLPVVTSRPCSVIALCMAETAMPTSIKDRVQAGTQIVARLTKAGISLGKIYVDPLIQPVSVDTRMGKEALGAISEIMNKFPGINTICGLSNVSFGLPCRHLLNRAFLTLGIGHGLSAAILDPTDNRLMATLRAAEVLLDRDEFCGRFIEAYQKGLLAD
ncbi:MAG: dihydropteroate synthase [Thermodesulfobacteriota bacterium]|nr:dihydropteroate synthase [Thermodesulfobacteriota bacterium]